MFVVRRCPLFTGTWEVGGRFGGLTGNVGREPCVWLGGGAAVRFLVWCLLLVVCWPVALLAVVVYPLVWLVALPLRLVGVVVGGVFGLVGALVLLPVRVLRRI